MAVRHYLDELIEQSQRILLLQGPIGHFFYEFAQWLKTQDKKVYKINFNAGDAYFYPYSEPNTELYSKTLLGFRGYLAQYCVANGIDNIVCFGDTRPYHKVAKKLARKLNIGFWVFEEGYFRPDYVTFEKSGVNNFSPLPRDKAFYLEQAPKLLSPPKPLKLAKGFCFMASLAVQFYVAANLGKSRYSDYEHHRIFNLTYYAKLWLVSGLKRFCYYLKDRRFAKKVVQGKFGEFFVVPLQVYDDSQVRVHSDVKSVSQFLTQVLQSFQQYAPAHSRLIVKHHPMDRGFIDYGNVITQFMAQYPELKGRVFYIHDVPMPVLLRHGKGMVTLNSTSGLSALLHRMPVITLGRANYNFEGLTYQGSLDSFWTKAEKPDEKVFNAYHLYHLNKTHLNGSFYNRVVLGYPYNRQSTIDNRQSTIDNRQSTIDNRQSTIDNRQSTMSKLCANE